MNRRSLWLSGLALLITTGTFAQPADMTVGTYVDGLSRQMAIKPAQKKAWSHYAGVLTNAGERMKHQHATEMAAMGTASWPERRKMVDQMVGSHKDVAGDVHKAATDLWQTMDTGQQQKAKNILPGLAVPPGPGLG